MADGVVDVCAVEGWERRRGKVEAGERVFDLALSVRQRRAILKALAAKAAEGDLQATAFLFDRIYGRPGVAHVAGATERAGTESGGILRLDIKRLNEEEMGILDRLLEKCVVKDDTAERA